MSNLQIVPRAAKWNSNFLSVYIFPNALSIYRAFEFESWLTMWGDSAAHHQQPALYLTTNSQDPSRQFSENRDTDSKKIKLYFTIFNIHETNLFNNTNWFNLIYFKILVTMQQKVTIIKEKSLKHCWEKNYIRFIQPMVLVPSSAPAVSPCCSIPMWPALAATPFWCWPLMPALAVGLLMSAHVAILSSHTLLMLALDASPSYRP